MDLVRLASVDSTSTHAADLLAQGKAPPFAVHAALQTGGRGRRGNAWVSPPGNLYLTLVLPPPPGPAAALGCLPLKAGIVVARLLAESYGIRLTLKWPNDLLFAGRKVGGLLLEGSTSGDRPGAVLIGIGLNLTSAPDLTGPYRAVSLQTILGRTVDAAACAEMLSRRFLAAWDALPLAQVPETFEDFSTGTGQIWCSADGRELAQASALRPDGVMALTPLTARSASSPTGGRQPAGGLAAPTVLTSADHGWRWLYQGDEPAPLAVADVGNSAVKLAWYADARSARPVWSASLDHRLLDEALPRALAAMHARAPASPWPLAILSVNPAAAAKLSAAAAVAGLSPLLVRKRPLRRHGDGYVLAELGIDRLAAIEGLLATLTAAERSDSRRFVVVVQAGTATTVDAVTTTGRHLGGLILPGLGTALASLHQAASLLPAVELGRDPLPAGDGLGHDTRSAMTEAALEMTAGAVERVVRSSAQAWDLKPLDSPITVTGGWGRVIAGVLGARYTADLVLSGARAMVLGGVVPVGG